MTLRFRGAPVTHNAQTWLQGHAGADSEDSDSSHPESPDAARDAGSVSSLILHVCKATDAQLDSDACAHDIMLPSFCDACNGHARLPMTKNDRQLLTIGLVVCKHRNTLMCPYA